MTTSAGTSSGGGRRWNAVSLLVILILAVAAGWTYRSVSASLREELGRQLRILVDADVKALELWMGQHLGAARYLAEEPEVQNLAEALLARHRGEAAADVTTELKDLEDASRELGFRGYSVISAQGVFLKATKAERENTPIRPEGREFLIRVLAGEAVLSPPVRSVDDPEPVMFAVAPIRAAEGEVVAVLGLLIPPEEFGRVLSVAEPGTSAETYAFNRRGVMISPSRFEADLHALDLLPPGQSSVLNVELRDPGVNLLKGQRPEPRSRWDLTAMATSAVRGESGSDTSGYRDYRGVEVVGAWRWLEEYAFGVATEVNAEEALRPLNALRGVFLVLLCLLVLAFSALLISAGLAVVFRGRMERAARLAQRLGQYTLIEKIGEGGMGQVYLARHALLRRPAALKLLDPGNATRKSVQRFEREVQHTSRLTHPNTISIYDYGRTPDGTFYYVMEYLAGYDLQKLVQLTGPMPEGRVLHVLSQVCGSLQEAHDAGLVHRDVKPGNIVLAERGGMPDVVKVLDFGLVKELDTDAGITAVDAIAGTPQYLSPEAVRSNEEVSPLSDLYGVGCIGYYLLTGVPVFEAGSSLEAMALHLKEPPVPPTQRVGREFSADLEELVLRCLAKDPAERPPSCRDLARLLRECSAASLWSEEQAWRWWQERRDQLPRRPVDAGGTGKSLSVEFKDRSRVNLPSERDNSGTGRTGS